MQHCMRWMSAGCAALLCGMAMLSAAEPAARFPEAPGSETKTVKPALKDLREISAGFWIKFNTLKPGTTADFGLFQCRIAQDGMLEVVIPCAPTEIMASRLVLKSKTAPVAKQWTHVEFSSSFNVRRCALYMDGKWQMENDELYLPQIRVGEPVAVKNFDGEVKGLKFYDVALEAEDLAISPLAAADFDAMTGACEKSASASTNPYLKKWFSALAQRASDLKNGAGESTTIGSVRRLKKDIANAETILAAFNGGAKACSGGMVTSYTVPSTTQALYLPYDLPQNGELSDTINVFAAQDEYESASIVVVPFSPVKSFTIQVSDLKKGADTIPASAVDSYIVKRWYRTGGAWMTYHADKRQRVLTPDLLIKDDKLFRVDEIRRTNEVRLDYPTASEYADISQYDYDKEWFQIDAVPLRDAKELQPVELTEAGRNQQYLLTIHVPKGAAPGIYHGTVDLLADGKSEGKLSLNLRVLPFELPEPRTYADPNKVYYSHINNAPRLNTCSLESYKRAIAMLSAYNLKHPSAIDETKERLAAAKDAGLDMKHIFGASGIELRNWYNGFGGPVNAITPEDKALMDKAFLKKINAKKEFYKSVLGFEPDEWYTVGASESSSYSLFMQQLAPAVELMSTNSNGKMMTHGMRDAIYAFSTDFNTMDSATRIRKDWSEIWHAAGGRQMNYANPFPGAENPAWYRRKLGLLMYKAHMDGHMLHGYIGRHYNEFSEWPGGDGNYRNFCMAYAQQGGAIATLKLLGTREGYDDVRYASLLKLQALKYRDSKNPDLAREAKRQLVWLELVNGEKMDYDTFRSAAVYRILTLMELAKISGGK